MCWCNPNLRTPCCGSVNCVPTKSSETSNNAIVERKTEVSVFKLFDKITTQDKEINELRSLLKECSILLVQGTEDHCTQLADQIDKYLQER